MRALTLLGLATLSVFTISPVSAQEQPNVLTLPSGQSLLHINATERQEIAQDMLVATLRIEVENADSGKVQNDINKAMAKALDEGKKFDDVKVQTLQYSIHKTTVPRTKEQVWRGSQGIQVKSTNAENVLNLVDALQDMNFLSNGLSYTLSPAKAAEIQDGMMEAALEKLQARAERAAKALGKSGADLIEVNVSGGHIPSPVSMYRGVHAEMAMMKSADVAAPVARAGETTLNLTVSAKALLKP
ncbi:MAG: SIMPL domain-containing protein [Pseudomonadota bacterium]